MIPCRTGTNGAVVDSSAGADLTRPHHGDSRHVVAKCSHTSIDEVSRRRCRADLFIQMPSNRTAREFVRCTPGLGHTGCTRKTVIAEHAEKRTLPNVLRKDSPIWGGRTHRGSRPIEPSPCCQHCRSLFGTQRDYWPQQRTRSMQN